MPPAATSELNGWAGRKREGKPVAAAVMTTLAVEAYERGELELHAGDEQAGEPDTEVARQMAAPGIWKMLEGHGVTDQTPLRLCFIYLAPSEAQAARLVDFIAQTDYDVDAREQAAGRKKQWVVAGATQPTAVDRETIDSWVQWMVAAGAAEGPCAFDGWTAELREDQARPG